MLCLVVCRVLLKEMCLKLSFLQFDDEEELFYEKAGSSAFYKSHMRGSVDRDD